RGAAVSDRPARRRGFRPASAAPTCGLTQPAYNIFRYTGPNRFAHPDRWATLTADLHWHVQILPRVHSKAGFEVGSGFYGDSVLPEEAAKILRAAL
ncbi:MAG TPA: hypothetical protein VMT45_07025, partial [Thermoanaerobaculaceae bacterium]|nr:hypothetical protein [Thermoanaerobaculaceae bacterium]